MPTPHSAVPLALLTACFVSSGCGKDVYGQRYAVSGTVTLDDKPLAAGQIVFIPLDATAGLPGASAAIDVGQYAIPAEAGPGAGKYRVQISRERKTGKRVPDYDAGPGDTKEEVVESIPPQYNSKSTLEADVTGDGTFDFPLTSKPVGR